MKWNHLKYFLLYFSLLVSITSIFGSTGDSDYSEIDQLIEESVERNNYDELIDLDTTAIQKAIRWSHETNYRYGLIRANELLGEFYERNDLALQAIRYYQLSLTEIKKGKDYFFERMHILYSIGYGYFTLGRFQEAFEIQSAVLKELEEELAKTNYDKNRLLIRKNITLISFSNLQINQGQLEEGLKNQLTAYQNTTPPLYGEDTLKYRYNKATNAFNLGYNYLILGDGQNARPYLEEFHNYVIEQGEDTKDLATSFGNLAYCEYLLKDFSEAYNYYEKSLTLSIENDYPDVTSITYKDLSDTYRADGKLTLAIDYLDKYYALKDSLEGIQVQTDLNNLKVKHESALQQQEIIRLNQQNQIQQQSTWLYTSGFIVFGLLSLLVIGYLVLQNKRRKEQSALQTLKLENAQQELIHKKQDVVQMALQISKRQEFSEHLIKQLRKFESFVQPNAKRDWHKLELKLKEYLLTNEDQKIFQENIDAINHAFYAKLNDNFPNLNQSDKELCSYLRLGLSNKEIAALRGVTAEAIRSSRFRLRKKLVMDSKEDVIVFLQTM